MVQQDVQILEPLGLQSHVPQGTIKKTKKISVGKPFWQPPPHGFLNSNIDGASKGNPGDVGYGGFIRDEEGNIKVIFHSHLGRATNNMPDLMAVEQCLEILIELNLHNTTIEADSELIIKVVKWLSTRTAPDKVLIHWRLLQLYH